MTNYPKLINVSIMMLISFFYTNLYHETWFWIRFEELINSKTTFRGFEIGLMVITYPQLIPKPTNLSTKSWG